MSTTTLTVTSPPQTSLSTDEQLAQITFIEPDTSCDPWDCDYVAIPRPLTLTHEELPLHDLRPEVFNPSGPYGLNKSGFTAVKHRSALHTAPYSRDSFLDEKLVTEVYIPETEELVKSVIGANELFIVCSHRPSFLIPSHGVSLGLALTYRPQISAGIRLHPSRPPLKTVADKLANPPTEPEICGVKFDLATMDLSKPYVGGITENQKIGPARAVHIDYSPAGAGKVLRNLRHDITQAVGDIIEAEDGMKEGDDYEGRRYALYSIWRPLKTVKRDPIAVCDGRSIDPDADLIEHVYKVNLLSLL